METSIEEKVNSTELITLTDTEQLLQDSGFTMTLQDLASGKIVNAPKTKSGDLIKNKNLMQKFNIMVSELDEDKLNGLNFQLVKYKDSKNEERSTISMDLKTITWFATPYYHNLRFDVVDFAFNTLKREKETLIEVKRVELEEAVKEAKQFKIYTNKSNVELMSVGKFIQLHPSISKESVNTALEYYKWQKVITKTTEYKRLGEGALDFASGVITGSKEKGTPIYSENLVLSLLEKYEDEQSTQTSVEEGGNDNED